MGTFFDDASLVMIPSGVKESKLYSIKPSNGDGDFTFSRGTDTATRVNSSGLIEKERSNQLLQSNSFDTTWVSFNATETSGQSGYDGSNDAWLLQITAASGSIRQTISASGVQTYSFYAKAGTTDWVAAYVATGGSAPYCFFDLTNGVKGATQNNVIDSSITDVGGGWYRIALVFNTTTTDVRIFPAEANAVLASQVGDNIYIQDAMLNQGLVAQPYIETTTAAVYEGITDNLPRLDYSGGASCPSLLLEPSRTNEVEYSEYFDGWIKSNISVANNVSTSPEGVQNATTIDVVSDASFASLRRNISVSANSTYTMSLFVKKETSETNYMGLGFIYSGGTTDVGYVIIDSVNGTAVSADPRIDVITNVVDFGDYWRIEATATDSGSNTSLAVYIYGTLSTNGTSVAVGTGSTRTIWGAQLEAGSYPTSYIPTMGTSASRAADVCNKSSATSIIGQTEGTMFVEAKIDANSTDDYNRIFGISQGNDSYRIIIFSNDQEKIALNVKNAAVSQVQIVSNISPFSTFKAAVGYSANDFVFYINGQQIGTDSSGTVPACDTISLGTHEDGSGTRAIEGNVKQALLFDTRLTNAELAALTTL